MDAVSKGSSLNILNQIFNQLVYFSWPRRMVHLLLKSGFGILQINYPGSIGYDDKYVQDLPGKVGTLDVEFCDKVITETLQKFKQFDANKVAIAGGSHGGFLVTHLAGKFPEKYKAVVALNPVLNIRSESYRIRSY